MREDLVQAGGGNSSVKINPDQMLIKASGFQLADLKENVGYCMVNPAVISVYFEKNSNKEFSQDVEKQFLTDLPPPPPT
ncbi:MAG: hypothetical protein IJ191_10255, partial [Treponema sp.]|nr:hypothetical protein [Treponema sp.]